MRSDDPSQPALLAPPSQAKENLGFPETATKNTTRVPGTDPTQTAAAIARAVFPDPARKPSAVTIVDATDWRVPVAASALMAPPFRAPILFTTARPARPVADRAGPSRADGLQGGRQRAGHPRRQRRRPPGYKSTDVRGATRWS